MIYLVRHGETAFNAEGRMQGQQDSPLTPEGEAQARQMGLRLRALKDQHGGEWRIIASPLGRTRATATLIAEALGLTADPVLDDRLIEVGFGSWEGLTRTEIARRHPETAGLKGLFLACPDGEPYAQVAARMAAFLAEHDQADGVHRVVVSHGGSGRVMRGVYGKLPVESLPGLEAPQDAFFRLAEGRIERVAALDEPA